MRSSSRFGVPQTPCRLRLTGSWHFERHTWPHGEPVRVRIGLHTGVASVIDGDYVGLDVHRAARICAAAHGGQVILSDATYSSVDSESEWVFEDLGAHRLKDLEHAERIWQVTIKGMPNRFPPLRSVRPPTNIPSYVDVLVGREQQRAELRAMLVGGERLVTVTGLGGTGKTRVAAAVALDALDDFPDGAFFVDLSAAVSELFASEIAQVLRVPLEGERPALDVIVGHVGARHTAPSARQLRASPRRRTRAVGGSCAPARNSASS